MSYNRCGNIHYKANRFLLILARTYFGELPIFLILTRTYFAEWQTKTSLLYRYFSNIDKKERWFWLRAINNFSSGYPIIWWNSIFEENFSQPIFAKNGLKRGFWGFSIIFSKIRTFIRQTKVLFPWYNGCNSPINWAVLIHSFVRSFLWSLGLISFYNQVGP